MGYFSNGTEGMEYEAKWCDRCVHASGGCAVWGAHLSFNYAQCKNTEIEKVLDILIPRGKDGWNLKCRMFKALKGKGGPDDDGEPMLFEKHEIGGKPVELKDIA